MVLWSNTSLVGIYETRAGIEQFVQASVEWLQRRVFLLGAPYHFVPGA